MRINIEDFIKILTLFTLIEISKKYTIDLTIPIVISVYQSQTDIFTTFELKI